MDELPRFALVTLTAILFIVDPIAVVPTYLVITQDETVAERRSTAFRACVAMTLLLEVAGRNRRPPPIQPAGPHPICVFR